MFRVLDMLCISFGDTISAEKICIGNRSVYRRTIPEFSLHLQTHWRFLYGNTILLGSGDIYTPFSKDVDENKWDYSVVGRPDSESSVFDVVCNQVSKALKGHHVAESSVTSFGDIRIVFTNGYVFEAFVSDSVKTEEWRLIDTEADTHFIFYDEEIE